jgi:hypothetical protein
VLPRYARALEERDPKGVAALFAPDGEFSLSGRYGRHDYVDAGVQIVGRDNIRAMIEAGSRPPGRGMHCLTSDHIVKISGVWVLSSSPWSPTPICAPKAAGAPP